MDIENMFTYGLLLYYGLEERTKQIEPALKMFKHLNARTFHGKYIEKFKKAEWPDINAFIENPKILIDFTKYYTNQIDEFFSPAFVEIYDFLTKNINHNFEDFDNIWSLMSDEIIKNQIQKLLYHSIAGSYQDLSLSQKELIYCSDEFNEALIRQKTTRSMPIKSLRNIKKMKEHFISQLNEDLPLNNEVIKNLPLKILKDIPTLSEKRVKQYFKKQLAIELDHLLKSKPMGYDERHITIGYCLALGGYCSDYSRFIKDDLPKKGLNVIKELDYTEYYLPYLRDQSRNILK